MVTVFQFEYGVTSELQVYLRGELDIPDSLNEDFYDGYIVEINASKVIAKTNESGVYSLACFD